MLEEMTDRNSESKKNSSEKNFKEFVTILCDITCDHIVGKYN